MPVITIADIPEVVRDTIRGVLQGIKEAGPNAEHPESIDFNIGVAFAINGIQRVQESTPTTSTTDVEQLTDDTTTHGRTQTEARDNRGGTVTNENSTMEDSGG